MPFITEVAAIFIQRFYTGWITLRNQLATPIKLMGRRVIELYDALISGNDWEVTSALSLKRRAGHTQYVNLNFPALNMISWKTNTMGTIPVIDTTGDIEFVPMNATAGSAITAKTTTMQSGLLGIGNYLYMGNTPLNLKYDGPNGPQGVTNWGISFQQAVFGPTTATTGANAGGSGVAWTNPTDVTGTSGFAMSSLAVGQNSQILLAGGFGFSIPATDVVTGVQLTFNLGATGGTTGLNGSYLEIDLFNSVSGDFGSKALFGTQISTTPVSVTLGGVSDQWAGTLNPANLNGSNFFLQFQFFDSNNNNTLPAICNINDVVITVFSGGTPSVSPTGSGTFSAVNGFSYVYAYGNSKSLEISNSSIPSTNTGPFTNAAYVGVPVVASADPQVDQIRVYRTTDTGGGNQYFEISNSPFANTTATVQDTTPDTSLQVTSQAEINLGNTPPPSGLINLEWFAGRMWGSVNNILYASTGPETLSGKAPQSNWNPLFQYVIPGPIQRLVTGPSGMLVFTLDDCYIVRGTDITNYTINEFIKDFGIRTYNAVDTDGTNLYVFTSDCQFICISSAGANDMGLPIGDQLLTVDPTQVYVKVNRLGLDSIVRILDGANNVYYDYNLNQQCWNLPGILQMPNATAAGSIETSPGVWRLLLSSNQFDPISGNLISAALAYRDINNYQDLGATYSPVAVFGSIQLADPGSFAKIGARGGFTLEYTNAGTLPKLSVLPNDIGCTLTNNPGAQVTGKFTIIPNPVPDPPTLAQQPVSYRSMRYFYARAKGLSALVRHLQFQIVAPSENTATELLGFAIVGDEKGEAAQGQIPQLQGR